ncbi:MAG: DJ-1/PfpI family protein [Tissierellales bacterium]|nr:DJ-1/PfpI family protein [Tissierellales bacterium]
MNKILIMLADGFEEVEALTCADYLQRASIEAVLVSISNEKVVEGSHKIKVLANKTLDEILSTVNYSGIIIPGGQPGATNLKNNKRVLELVREFYEEDKLVASICAGPTVLHEAGILEGKRVTCFPGYGEKLTGAKVVNEIVVRDENIITAMGPAAANHFAVKIVEALRGTEKAKELRKTILLDIVENKR